MEDKVVCYICFEHESKENQYASEPPPCVCKGSIVIHKTCLQNVIKTSRNCTICKTKYKINYLPQKDGRELVIEVSQDGERIEYTVNERGEKHGSYTIKNREGRMVLLHSYINGVMEGPYIEYYPNGQIKSVCKCRNNRIEGEYCEWAEDGSVLEESNYKDGKKHGECIRWMREGFCRTAVTLNYVEGEAEGGIDHEY
jgi:antitoxin component YwqK of YwqJK toxin-antitoxin module